MVDLNKEKEKKKKEKEKRGEKKEFKPINLVYFTVYGTHARKIKYKYIKYVYLDCSPHNYLPFLLMSMINLVLQHSNSSLLKSFKGP